MATLGTYAVITVIGMLRAVHVTMAIVSSSSTAQWATTSTSSSVAATDPATTDSDAAYHTFNVSASYRTTEPVTAGGATFAAATAATSPSPITDSDLQCLSQLPVDKLLRIRKTLRFVSHMLDDGVAAELPQHSFPAGQRRIGPGMMAATAAVATGRRHVGGDGYAFEVHQRADGAQAAPLMMDQIKEKVGYDDGWVAEEKPSKVQKIFQLSVTTLAFLAFGGYLLCMIVQAIKSKGTTYYHPALLPMVTASGGEAAGLNQISQISIRKRRPARLRRAAEAKAARQQRQHTNSTSAGPSPEDLYKVLVMAAEGYVRISAV